jgi:hypothetical protein
MHLGSRGRIRRLLPHHRMNSPRKETLLPFVYTLADGEVATTGGSTPVLGE